MSHANSAPKDIARFGFEHVDAYLAFIRAHVPPEWRVTASPRVINADNPDPRGRRDDRARIRDLQNALSDPDTCAIVALNGGAWFTRILPQLDFTPLARRRTPLVACGFSEMTNFVNIVASYRAGRGVYWLCPNYLAWKIQPPEAARNAFAEFWRNLPEALELGRTGLARRPTGLTVQRLSGPRPADAIRFVGGCLSVLCANLAGPLAARVRPDGRWLVLEDVNEQLYRIDRYLATLKLAGWFERVAGIALADFHAEGRDQTAEVRELLALHTPPGRRVPIIGLPRVGHTWPMEPLWLNRPLVIAPTNAS